MPERPEPPGPKPPLASSVKLEINWVSTVGRQAHNITYAQFPSSTDTSVNSLLVATGNSLWNAITVGTGSLAIFIATGWQLTSVTCFDNSGASDNAATTTYSAIAGSGPGLPPQCAVCLSWQIPARYRGGKPRWYLPGVLQGALNSLYDSALNPTIAANYEAAGNALLNKFNTTPVSAGQPILGTISYYSHYTLRPTPLFRPFLSCKVHERLDSQRRRSGKEITFGSVP